MVGHPGNGPDALACRHDDHGSTANVLYLPTHSSGTTTKSGKEGGDKEKTDGITIPFTQKLENWVEFGCESSENVFFGFGADGWCHWEAVSDVFLVFIGLLRAKVVFILLFVEPEVNLALFGLCVDASAH